MVANIAAFPDWKTRLVRKKSGDPYSDERNLIIAMEGAPELAGFLRYDEFRDRVELTRPLPNMPRDTTDAFFEDDPVELWSDEHVTLLTAWLLSQGFVGLSRHAVQDVAIVIAKRTTTHPVREYLLDCEAGWDGEARLDTWLRTYLGAKDHADYLQAVGPKFLIGAAARVLSPGCQMDTMLVLEGGQGIGKSTAVRALAKQWSADLAHELSGKDAAIHIQGVWIAEMSELSAIRRSEQEIIKGFLSRRTDRYRPPYGRNALDRPRQCVFIATTNDDAYLNDPTGARRFWPVECSSISLERLERDVDQIWGEAVSRYRHGERWHLDAAQTRCAAIEQASRHRLTPVDSVVLEYADTMRSAGLTRLEMRELLTSVFDLNTREDPAKAGGLAMQAARALTSHGWKRLKPVGRGQKRRQHYEYMGEIAVEEPQNSQASQGSQADNEGLTHDVPF